MLRDVLQLNEAESIVLKETAGMKVDLETCKAHCKRQIAVIVKLKEELSYIKVYCWLHVFCSDTMNMVFLVHFLY